MHLREVTQYLETIAPPSYQESYDNSGLITGSPDLKITGILLTLDCIEEVVQEAIHRNCNLIIAHHPILFKGLKRLTGNNYIERTLLLAIRHNIGIYAIHTNLDHVFAGVNNKICSKIGLKDLRILAPKSETLTKLVTFIPKEHVETVTGALHKAGAGQIGNYKECSFSIEGTGTFRPTEAANPHIGEANRLEMVQEIRVEVILPSYLESAIVDALRKSHPYEEVAYYLNSLSNDNQEVGAGMTGMLDQPMEPVQFLKRLKSAMDLHVIRHTSLLSKSIQKVAVCGGSGSFLLPQAIKSGADIFITADFKYHEFFDADNRIIVADIGHYESEVFTKDLLMEHLIKKFPTFAINFSRTDTNPVRYFID